MSYPIFGIEDRCRAEHIEELRKGQESTVADDAACTMCGATEPQHDGWYALPHIDMSALVCGRECAGDAVMEGRPNGWCGSSEITKPTEPK